MVLFPGDGAQLLLCAGHRATACDDGRRTAVARGARNLHVGDGNEADFKAPLGLLELPLSGLQRRILGRQLVFGTQHGKIAVGDACDQFLSRRVKVGFGLGHGGIGLLQVDPAVPGEQVHRQSERRGGRIVDRRGIGACADAGPALVGRGIDRQHVQEGLGLDFARAHVHGLGLLHGRIGGERLLVDVGEVGGRGHSCHVGHCQSRHNNSLHKRLPDSKRYRLYTVNTLAVSDRFPAPRR